MRLLLDQGLPRSAALILREKQIDTAHVGELDMSTASDESIISYARQHAYSIVTLDADFHSLLALADAKGPSVIRIRVQRLKAQELASLVLTVLERIGHEIEAGSFITVTATTIRIRRLPIKKAI
jgi:predicted nuclease of predicted toxin-antitoxin system